MRLAASACLAVALSIVVGSAANAQVADRIASIAPLHLPGRETRSDASPAEYRIGVGDELDISVWGEERMQRSVRVLPDGSFAFPLAGTIDAAGRTIREVSETIRQRIAPNYRATVPDVTVGLRSAADIAFFVVGKVRTPGSYASRRAVDILQALSMAGGLAEFADAKNAVILRQTGSGRTVEPVRLSQILKGHRALDAGALAEPLPLLGSGDVLVVP